MSGDPVTKLARDMGVRVAPGVPAMDRLSRRALNGVLRTLDADERRVAIILGAAGDYDWHMMDGTGRIWHFREGSTRAWWNMVNDATERYIFDRVTRLFPDLHFEV